jgi:hypothetical protein
MATALLELPPELIVHIFHYLDDPDFLAARVIGKHLERASFSTFGKRFFRKKGYMITTASIDVLQHVASHEELRPYVQHVWFNPDCYTTTLDAKPFPPDHFDDWNAINAKDRYSDNPEINRKNHEAHTACVADNSKLLCSPQWTLADKLTSAFLSLPNLKTVGMRRSDQHSPWGWKTLMDAVGRDPRNLAGPSWHHRFGASRPTLLYVALIKAIAASGAKIQRLYTDTLEIDLISLRVLPLDIIARACNSLLYLEVNVAKCFGNAVYHPLKEDEEWENHCLQASQYGSGLIKLLRASPKLRELGLMIFEHRSQSSMYPTDDERDNYWRGSYPCMTMYHAAGSVELQNLRRVKLEKFATSPASLLSVLQPSAKHLTSIKLRDVRLLDDPGTNTGRPWQAIFSFLVASCPKLSYLLLHHLSHLTGTIRFIENLPPPDANVGDNFTSYENISVEAGVAHSDPDTEGPEKRATVLRAREAVGERVRALVDGHWYGQNLFTYEMDEVAWHTDTSDEEW